jgi:hypothetical protein
MCICNGYDRLYGGRRQIGQFCSTLLWTDLKSHSSISRAQCILNIFIPFCYKCPHNDNPITIGLPHYWNKKYILCFHSCKKQFQDVVVVCDFSHVMFFMLFTICMKIMIEIFSNFSRQSRLDYCCLKPVVRNPQN